MNWKESWIDKMGLIVTLSGNNRFTKLSELKSIMASQLTPQEVAELKECFRQRFTPTGGLNGCRSATDSVNQIIK